MESSRVENFDHFTGKTVLSTLPMASRCAGVVFLSNVTTAQIVGIPGPGL